MLLFDGTEFLGKLRHVQALDGLALEAVHLFEEGILLRRRSSGLVTLAHVRL